MSNEETAKDQPEENTDALAQANDLPAETPEDAAVSEIDDSSDGVGDTDVTEEVIQAAPNEEEEEEDEKEEEAGEDCPACNKGAPAWMATFADMATLLMAFFVLILSFAQVNVPKYKEVAGSMRSAFGVQTVIPSIEPPTAESIILQQYERTVTDPTASNRIEEQKTDEPPNEDELSFNIGDGSAETNAIDLAPLSYASFAIDKGYSKSINLKLSLALCCIYPNS